MGTSPSVCGKMLVSRALMLGLTVACLFSDVHASIEMELEDDSAAFSAGAKSDGHCAMKHHANMPICKGAQTQYVLQCAHEPRQLYKEEPELGESAYSSGYASGGGAAAAKVVVPPEETLRDHMTPALMVCQVELDKSKLMCKKAVTKAYQEFKAAEDALKPKSKLGESTDSDDENIVEKLYDEAVENMGGKLGDEFRKLTTPKNPVV